MEAGAPAEHEQVAERVAAEPVGAVHAASDFAGRIEARYRRLLRLGVDLHATHDVMRGRPDFHRVFGDVDLRELFELMIHAGQLLM